MLMHINVLADNELGWVLLVKEETYPFSRLKECPQECASLERRMSCYSLQESVKAG